MAYFYREALIVSAVIGGLVAFAGGAAAQDQPAATGTSCLATGSSNTSSIADQFALNPQGLLDRNPRGGLALSNEVRTLVISDVSVLEELLDLMEDSLPRDQASAVGAGLARAAAVCVITRPDLAQLIQAAIATSGNDDLVTAFRAASPDSAPAAITETADTGGGAGGGAGGAGGGAGGIGGAGSSAGGAGGGSSAGAGTGSSSNPSSNSLSGGGGGGSTSTTTSVSPTA